MQTHHPDNERIKRRYLIHLKETRGFSEPSLDQVIKAIDRYESYTRLQDFRHFNVERVKAFKEFLSAQQSMRTKERLSSATIYSTLHALKSFFEWLAGQRGYKAGFQAGDWEYFNPSNSIASVAKAHRPSRAPTIDQIRHVLHKMKPTTDVTRRDRALVAFLIVTGARCGALATIRLRHIDIERRVLFQDARTVRTKFSKTFETWFFPVGDDLEQTIIDWVRFLVIEKLWGLDDPLFPSTEIGLNASGRFHPIGLRREPWASTGAIRSILGVAFERAGLPAPNPHSFRNTLVALGRDKCKTWAEMQAWAQNLGHESLTTTFGSYGKVAAHEQGNLVRNAGRSDAVNVRALLERLERLEAASH